MESQSSPLLDLTVVTFVLQIASSAGEAAVGILHNFEDPGEVEREEEEEEDEKEVDEKEAEGHEAEELEHETDPG